MKMMTSCVVPEATRALTIFPFSYRLTSTKRLSLISKKLLLQFNIIVISMEHFTARILMKKQLIFVYETS